METKFRIKTRRWFRVAFLLLPVIAVIDTLIPFLFKRVINAYLGRVTIYKGRIGGINISMLKRRILLNNVIIDKVNAISLQQTAFVSIADMEVSFVWKELWKGQLVLDIESVQPSVTINRNRLKQLEGLKMDLNFPVIIRSINILEGTFDYVDATKEPIAAVGAEHITLNVSNTDNLPLSKANYTVSMTADVCEGKVKGDLVLKLDHLRPNFDLNFAIHGMNLTCLNGFFMAYAKFDVNKGQLDLFIEAEAKTGEFGGYIKPIIRDLDVLGTEDKGRGIASQLWQGVLGLVAEVLENQRHDQLATKVPFRGTFSDPKVNVTYAVVEVVLNAFVKAISPSFDYWSQDIFKKRRA